MIAEPLQATPEQNLLRARKDKHTYSISTEAFSSHGRQFVLHNIALKREYHNSYDIFNYRRGLTYLEEIIDFKNTAPIVARKGLRKFTDLLPEYVDLKESHVSTSKFHTAERNRLLKPLQDPTLSSFLIYTTEKLNGQNAQFSFFQGRWIIGSKNKSLLVTGPEDLLKLRNKHQHRLTTLIAQAWFALLSGKTEQELKGIQMELSNNTLIGEYCNSDALQHLVDYGKQPQLYFYALVEKKSRTDDCQPTSLAYKFLQTYGLPPAKVRRQEADGWEEAVEKLRATVVRTSEQTMREGGQGNVVYVSGVSPSGENCLLVCKVKTIEYRIYRKLRQKLKVYIQKLNKGYDNLLKKFTKEIAELAREFQVNRPLETYVQLAKRSFELCLDQSRPISRFVHNRFIDFMRLVEKNITREKFMEIVNSSAAELADMADMADEQEPELSKEESKDEVEEGSKQQPKGTVGKKVIVLIPVSIPSTGKTTLLQMISKEHPGFTLWSVSNDEIKRKVMDELRKKKKTMTREQAFEKSREPGNKEFFSKIGQTLRKIALSFQPNHILYLDKNHPENVLRKTIDCINDAASPLHNLKVMRLGLFPSSLVRFEQKGAYRYPFSAAYMLTCLKRVISRPEHLTLEGSDEDRCRIVLGFINLFRNFSLSPYNIRKYFDGKVDLLFNNQQALDPERDSALLALFKEVVLAGKPGNFDYAHPKLGLLVNAINQWNLQELSRQELAACALVKVRGIFENFDTYCQVEEKEQKE